MNFDRNASSARLCERFCREFRRSLPEFIAAARLHVMTDEELQSQRISFAYGNIALHNPTVTTEDVRKAAAQHTEQRVRDALPSRG